MFNFFVNSWNHVAVPTIFEISILKYP